VIAPDANLLIYANNPATADYRASRNWLEDLLSSSEPVGIPILSLYAFLRFMTNSAIHPRPVPFRRAAEIIDEWLALPHVQVLYPGDHHWALLAALGADSRASGNVITDAAIAAIAIEYGATIHTNDHHFARFPNLRWLNPLKP
jgi:toxin-antitoxin system PIN domain toxin